MAAGLCRTSRTIKIGGFFRRMVLPGTHTIGLDTDADDQSCGDRTDPVKERVSGKNFFLHEKRFDADDRERICVKRIAQGTHAVDANKGQADGPALTFFLSFLPDFSPSSPSVPGHPHRTPGKLHLVRLPGTRRPR